MAKQETQAPAEGQVVEPVESAEISLDEFCSRLSETVKSPEAIGGFHFTERAAGTMRGTFEAYRARFDEFLNKPV